MTRFKKFTPMQSKKILGIDPGYGRIGIAVMKTVERKQELIHSECFETSSKLPYHKRLLLVGEKISQIIQEYQPEQVALETLLFSKNQKTAMQVSEARGVIIFVALKHNVLVREFNPNQIKLAVTGYGKSDKKQVILMVEKLVKMPPLKKEVKRHDDEYDAIACALTASAITLSTALS